MNKNLELIALALIFLLVGGVFGWAARAITADHRYSQSLAARHEAEAHYWLTKMDNDIRESKDERKTHK